MHHIGIDIVEIARIEQAIMQWQDSFLKRIYTEAELDTSSNRIPTLAANFAAKEAVMKALGTGTKGVGWREIEVVSDPNGKPLIQLHGRARNKANEIGISDFSISLSHTKEYAVASVVGNT